jgi:hypothetical protein
MSDIVDELREIAGYMARTGEPAGLRDAAICDRAREEIKSLRRKLEAAKSVLWMAERYTHLDDLVTQGQFDAAKEIIES